MHLVIIPGGDEIHEKVATYLDYTLVALAALVRICKAGGSADSLITGIVGLGEGMPSIVGFGVAHTLAVTGRVAAILGMVPTSDKGGVGGVSPGAVEPRTSLGAAVEVARC